MRFVNLGGALATASAVNVLVTGVAGFIAPHVAAHFHQLGHLVLGVDKEVPEVEPPYSVRRLDLASPAAWSESGWLSEVDVVCHLGGVGDAACAAGDPALAIRDNVTAVTELVQAAAAAGVGRVLVGSSWHVYGRADYEPVDELHPCRPIGVYSISKLAGEQMALMMGASLGVEVVCLRLGTAYGPGMRPRVAVRAFVEHAAAGKPLVVTKDRHSFRQFTHVTDLARAFVLATTGPVGGGVYNVVADEPVHIHDLASRLAERFRSPLVAADLAHDTDSFHVSSDSFRSLGWEPRVSFDEGLEEAVRLYGAGSRIILLPADRSEEAQLPTRRSASL
jgi:UDP-glucose 4-epimerase